MPPKVLNLLFVRALADRLRNLPIIVNAVDPGYAISELRRNVQGFTIYLYFYFMDLLLALPTEKSSRRLVWGALGEQEDEEKMRGAYIGGSRVVEPSDFVLGGEGQQVQEKIWVCAPCIIEFYVFNK
jgi:retinol dehydrogenase-12